MNNFNNLELRQLLTLEAIATTGSFWGAAEKLNFSQSSVSQHVAALEALTGQRLIERSRGKRTVEFTEAGRLLLGHASAIGARLRAAEADFRAIAAGESGTLRIGVYQSVAARILPLVMSSFRAQWPGVQIQLIEEVRDEDLLDALERGDLDLTFSVRPLNSGPFESVDVLTDPYVILFPAGARQPADRPALRTLQGVDMVGSRWCRSVELVERQLTARGIEPNIVFRTDDNGAIQGMVAAGLGLALQPLLAVDAGDPRIVVVQPREEIPPRVIALAWHRDRYRAQAADSFVKLAREVGAEIEAEQTATLARMGTAARVLAS